MSISFSDAAKAKQLREFFARHGRVFIVVNATSEDVKVPPHLMGDPALRLVLNQRMPQPIYIRDDALVSDFSFGGKVFPCRIPMHAIWAVYLPEGDLDQGIVWEDDVPEIIRAAVQEAREGLEDGEQSVDDDGEAADSQDAPSGGRRVRHLRVIK
ncbi:MAG: hypothetical protein D6703_03300 [Zetaproteobacteria bacterium]|nr:MAG: hypothetical protein D6703_03300 [Zetaproteobacteria bacterium]